MYLDSYLFPYLRYNRAARAQEEGKFKEEIVPVRTKLVDKDGNEQAVVVSTRMCTNKGRHLNIIITTYMRLYMNADNHCWY